MIIKPSCYKWKSGKAEKVKVAQKKIEKSCRKI